MAENSQIKEHTIIISLKNVEKTYITYSESLHILRGVDLEISRGEIVSIMGPSGSGKSTLLNILGLLDTYDSGVYTIADIDTSNLSAKMRQQIRLQKIGFVFQTFNLIQTLTVEQNIELPMNLLKKSQEEQHQRSAELLAEFGMTSKTKKFPYQLSIGEQQRVAIARALVNDPVIVLCDEPTGNLDEENAQIILNHLAKLKQFNTTILIVSHNPSVKEITDRNFILSHGKIQPTEPNQN
ncbi:MAG: ABC transporter ATP-binding protein [Promethearchaeia archaeon]|nr:MAG: ABC transporter ATP-binding protein [Candidatus Lokiarchaeia archaeon]